MPTVITVLFAIAPSLQAFATTAELALQIKGCRSKRPALRKNLLPDWREIEKRLTKWIVNIYRQHHAIKMEVAQTILG